MMAQKKQMSLPELAKWREKLRRGDDVLHLKTVNNVDKLIAGRIRSTQRRGVELKTKEGGHIGFAFWTDLYPLDTAASAITQLRAEQPESSTPMPRAKTLLGSGAVRVLINDGELSKPAPVELEEPEEEPEEALETPRNAEPARPLARRRQRQVHELTAIGNIFRAERLKRCFDQKGFAPKLGMTYGKLSEIELGDAKPDDDAMLKLSELTGVSLDVLLEARDGADATGADPLADIQREHEMLASLDKLGTELAAARRANAALAERAEAADRDKTEAVQEARRALQDQLDRANALDYELLTARDQLNTVTLERDAAVNMERQLTERLASVGGEGLRILNGAELARLGRYLEQLQAIQPKPTDEAKLEEWFAGALKMFKAYL